MASNAFEVLLPYIGEKQEFKFHEAIKLKNPFKNLDKKEFATTEEFWDAMPYYMIKLIMSSDPESRVLPFAYQRPKRISSGAKEIYTNPLDVFIYTFQKSDPLMKQIIINQLSKCQLSLPLVIMDKIFSRPIIYPFAYQSLIKSHFTSDGNARSFHVADEKLSVISFIRIGKCKKSIKSKLLNKLLGLRNDCFFNKDCKGSSVNRLLYDGTIEMNWYLPKKELVNEFHDPLTFLNLRGNAFEFAIQAKFIFEISTMVGIILTCDDIGENEMQELGKLTREYYDQICLIFTDDNENEKYDTICKFCNQLPKFAQNERNVIFEDSLELIANEVRKSINESIKYSKKFSINDYIMVYKTKELAILIEDEFVGLKIEYCNSRMKSFNDNFLTNALKNLDPTEYLPLQHEGWKKFANADREQLKLRNERDIFNKVKGMCEKKFKLTAARNFQLNSLNKKLVNNNHGVAIGNLKYFMLNSGDAEYSLHMLTLLRMELEKSSFSNSNPIGVQHFIREYGQYYEMNCNIDENTSLESIKKYINIDYAHLPTLFAKLLLLGQPFEIFDGEVQHMPLIWVQAVLNALSEEVGDEKRIFVLGVLGIQSSGKSTLLNTMFGLQFPVASGRCTRGVSMQLIEVDKEYANIINYDYLVVLDSEGLRSMENSNKDIKSCDNEFTTLMIGISDLNIINIYGENFTEWQDIFQIIIMTLMNLTSCTKSKPKCLFVHQNISDPNAKNNLREGYQKFLLKLDDVTHFFSTETKSNPSYTKFTDIIDFDINESIYFIPSLLSMQPPMSIVSKDYADAVRALKKDIISKHTYKTSIFNFLDWSKKVKTVWKSVLRENFVSNYSEILKRIYYNEFENALYKWSQNYVCEIEKVLLLSKDQIINGNCEELEETIGLDLVEKCKTILNCEEKEFEQYYFKNHNQRQVFLNWKTHAELHFKNTRLDYEIKMRTKLSNIAKIAKRNQQLQDDFYGKREIIIERAKITKLELLSDTTRVKDVESFDEYYEREWEKWLALTQLKLSVQETPCVNFTLLLKREIDELSIRFFGVNIKIDKIQAYFKQLEENKFSLNEFVIGNNHYRMYIEDGSEQFVNHKYSCWLDFECGSDEKVEEIDHKGKLGYSSILEVVDLKNIISELGITYINEVIKQEFSISYFKRIIEIAVDFVKQFNNKRNTDKTIKMRVEIEDMFIYEISLFLCTKLIFNFKAKHKPNKMDALKYQLKCVFINLYHQENSFLSKACSNGLVAILLEKLNLYLADTLQFVVFSNFSDLSASSVLSKCHLQTKVLTDLAKELSFENYSKYIHDPNLVMNHWISGKFIEFCKSVPSLARMLVWYKDNIQTHIKLYTQALHQSLESMEEICTIDLENTVKIKCDKNSKINPEWKSVLHKLLDGEHARQFKLSDLDVLIIEPHEITKSDELVSFFKESIQKQSEQHNFENFIETNLMVNLEDTFSDIICQSLFFCAELCPLCNEPCLSNINSKEHKHYCGSFHRPLGLNGWYKLDSGEFVGYDCTNLKGEIITDNLKHKELIFENCMKDTEGWDSSGKHHMIESVYWEWVMCQFPAQFATYYEYNVNEKAIRIWSNLTKTQVLNGLQRQTNDFHSPAFFWRAKKKINNFFASKTY